MAYHTTLYLVLFLPASMIAYQLMPVKYRFYVLLLFGYYFYYCISGTLIIYIMAATITTYLSGLLIEKKKGFLIFCILLLMENLAYMKYYNFFAANGNRIISFITSEQPFTLKAMILPIGISFYTLSAAGYLIDIYYKKIPAEKNIGKLALFLSFFPTIMEGPICRYGELGRELFAGRSITMERLATGAQRIFWGLFKKMLVADRLDVLVKTVYDGYQNYDGTVISVAAVAYTIQLYMEFSGCMDIVIGTGEIFGITLPENFRRPFFSKTVSEFWRRWHITLGSWFKEYVFYPVSMWGPVRKLSRTARKHNRHWGEVTAAALGLFPVWLCNGIWHGPRWSYIFYGLYYFVLITLSIAMRPCSEKLCRFFKLDQSSALYHLFQVGRTFLLVVIGELFFRAEGLRIGLQMFARIFTQFNLSSFWNGTLLTLGLDRGDYLLIGAALTVVFFISLAEEKGRDVRRDIKQLPLPLRWSLYYSVMMAICLFGAYGVGYMPVELIYANF